MKGRWLMCGIKGWHLGTRRGWPEEPRCCTGHAQGVLVVWGADLLHGLGEDGVEFHALMRGKKNSGLNAATVCCLEHLLLYQRLTCDTRVILAGLPCWLEGAGANPGEGLVFGRCGFTSMLQPPGTGQVV